jgi:hypothetical protein
MFGCQTRRAGSVPCQHRHRFALPACRSVKHAHDVVPYIRREHKTLSHRVDARKGPVMGILFHARAPTCWSIQTTFRKKFLALVVEFVAIVVDVEKIAGHRMMSCKAAACSTSAAYFGGCNAGELAQCSKWDPVSASRAFLSNASRSGPSGSREAFSLTSRAKDAMRS